MVKSGHTDAVASTPTHPDSQPEPSQSSSTTSGVELQSLAPEYKKERHETYVKHLQRAVANDGNKNIALTGRYGSGKSSILDKFAEEEQRQGKNVMRISINTLGPDVDEDIANRIQKELVKQLIYRAEPGKLSSKYGRQRELPKKQIFWEAVGASLVLLGLLRLFDVWPSPNALWSLPEVFPGIAFALLVVAAAWAARWVVGRRLISEVAAGGTSIKLERNADTYFDEYLHDIVTFFETDETDIVIFEDLDRFDNERIFDSLRELNTLLNASQHVRNRSEPLQFVYAIKDSLFEKLGDDLETREQDRAKTPADQSSGPEDRATAVADTSTAKKTRDAAQAEVERANRTKFFEIVIPVVPFLSHNNARDLLDETLKQLKLPSDAKISRPLLDLVARHTTDMRLLINICNEFVVFAERLLWSREPAPGMSPDNLFALVVYKNFHLTDFERLPQRNSDLDALSAQRSEIVRHSIKKLQQRRRDVRTSNDMWRQQARTAERLGQRLKTMTTLPVSFRHIEINDEAVALDNVGTVEFWQHVHLDQGLVMVSMDQNGRVRRHSFTRDEIEVLFPEALDEVRWREPAESYLDETRTQLDAQIAALRGADFADLVGDPSAKSNEGRTFDGTIDDTLKSQLAQDLVRHGFIDRYYAEYASPFYGEFIGVDVANFFRNCVWPNEMDIDFTFTTEHAVRNVMEQAPSDFTSSRSVFHTSIIDHVLQQDRDAVQEVVRFIMTEPSDDRDRFLREYLSDEGSRAPQLVAQLAECGWSPLVNFLASLDAEDRHQALLMDAALMHVDDAARLDLDEGAGIRIRDHHRQLSSFTRNQPESRSAIIRDVIEKSHFEIPELVVLGKSLKQLIITNQYYALTAENLRNALETEGPVGLEEVMSDEQVWKRCSGVFSAYLDVVAEDSLTPSAVRTAATLAQVIAEEHEGWEGDELARLLELSMPSASLPDIMVVPEQTQPAVVAARRMVATAANVHSYAQTHQVDEPLAALIGHGADEVGDLEQIEGLSSGDTHDLAVRLLNAHDVLDVDERISLVLQLYPSGASTEFDTKEFHPVADDPRLLGMLLEAGLVADPLETFQHFLAVGGWPVIASAFEISEKVSEFLTPELVQDDVAVPDLLTNSKVATTVKRKIMSDLSTYVPDGHDGHDGALRAAARYARDEGVDLPADQIRRIAGVVQDPELVLLLMGTNESLSASEIFAILPLLGGDYAGFGLGPGHQFVIPKPSEEAKDYLTRLKHEGLIDIPRGGKRGTRTVKNLK